MVLSTNEDEKALSPGTGRELGSSAMSKVSSKSKHVIEHKKLGRAKDELEYATNWRRVFIGVYQHLKWLNSYATINHIAMHKILKKFLKEHFENADNIIDKNLREFID